MRRTARVDDDGSDPSPPQDEAASRKRCREGSAVSRLAPSRQHLPPKVVERHARALLDQALPWGEPRDGPLGLSRPGRDEPVGHVGASLPTKAAHNRPRVLRWHGGQPELALDDTRALLAAGIVMGEIDHGARGTNESVGAMLVQPALLVVFDPAVGLREHAELNLEQCPEPVAGRSVVGNGGIGAAEHMVDGPVGPPAGTLRHQLPQLCREVRAAEAARRDQRDLVLVLHEMARESSAEPGTARRAADHCAGRARASGISRTRAA